jgi:hypothetical protein
MRSRCHGFTTRFESMGAHGCEEQWYARDTMIYTGSSLREDKIICPMCVSVL